METKVKIHPLQDVPASELNNMQLYAEQSVDAIVKELLFDEARFTGFAPSKVDSLNLAIGAGRLFTGGKAYAATEPTSLSLVSLVPTTNSRIVLVVVSGDTVETATASRRFLVDVDTRQTQPRAVATRIARQAVIGLVAGTAAAVPARPAVPAGAIVIASLVLTPTGIDGTIDVESDNAALSLEKAVGSITLLAGALGKVNSLLETVRSEIAGLSRSQQGKADQIRVRAIENNLLYIREKLELPDTRVMDGFDNFSTATETDPADADNTSELEAGRMVFGKVEKTKKMTALLNPNDSKVDKTAAGLIMPAGVDALRIECKDKDGDVAIASYQVTVSTLKKRQLGRYWRWYAWVTGRNFQEEWFRDHPNVRLYDPLADAWETIDLAQVDWKLYGTGIRHIWRLWIDGVYWERGQVTKTFTGSRLCQTFLCAQSGWHSRIDLAFTAVGATGDVHVAVCELTEAGYANEAKILETATVPVGSLKTWPTWTRFDFEPFWLERGKRYGLIITTAGNHKIAVSTSNDLTNGVLQVWTAGSIWSNELAKDACFRLYGRRFNQTNVIVDIEDVTLAGGIAEIQTILTGYEPKGTALVVQARIAGVWRNLDEDDETVLAGAPTQVPLRFVFQGTKDIMPAIDLSKSALIVSRPRSTSVHRATVRTLPVGVTTTTVKVVEEAIGFDAAKHGWTVALLTGAGFATVNAATSVTTKTLANGRTQRVWTFSGLPAIDAYKIRTTKTTSDAASAFEVDYRRDHAL